MASASFKDVVRPTVLILGAGCSQPYGFPLGPQLRDAVCALDEYAEEESFAELGISRQELEELITSLRHSGHTSVDWFLETRPDLASVGKAAIARCLIPFEDPGRLFPPRCPREHWYELLLNQLDGSMPFGDTVAQGVSVITFNYDRSLEYYLLRVLATRRRSESAARDELSRLRVLHLHGALGGLRSLAQQGRLYSTRLDGEMLRIAAEGLVVVGEADESAEPFQAARALLSSAERVVMLGFGFHRQSLRRLELVHDTFPTSERRYITGTSWRVPDPVWAFVSQRVFTDNKRHSVSVYKFLQSRMNLGPERQPVIA